jgi:hypothetical protein
VHDHTLTLLAQAGGDVGSQVAVLIGGGVLLLWVFVLVKFLQVANDVRLIARVLSKPGNANSMKKTTARPKTEDPLLTEAARLREMGRLRDEGLLTEDEFESLKSGLLGR